MFLYKKNLSFARIAGKAEYTQMRKAWDIWAPPPKRMPTKRPRPDDDGDDDMQGSSGASGSNYFEC